MPNYSNIIANDIMTLNSNAWIKASFIQCIQS